MIVRQHCLATLLLVILPLVSLADTPPPPVMNGCWTMTLQTTDLGALRTMMVLTQEGGSVEGHSHEAGAAIVASWFERLVVGITSSSFANGALLHWRQGAVTTRGDSVLCEAVISSAAGSYWFQGRVAGDSIEGRLSRRGIAMGYLSGRRGACTLPLDDYRGLVDSLERCLEANLYDPGLMRDGQTTDVLDDVRELGQEAMDDADMMMRFYRLRTTLPFSHCYLYRPATMSVRDTTSTASDPGMRYTMGADSIGILTIKTFAGTASTIDTMFDAVRATAPRALVIDLRGNGGGNVSALRVASYLVPDTVVAGAFLTRRWQGARGERVDSAQWKHLPSFATASIDSLFKELAGSPGLRLVVVPAAGQYRGSVYVLTDGQTASACEPLVDGLRRRGRATIVGERTAGAMLSAEPFALPGGWTLVLPTADFRTPDGLSIDQRGVEPHVDVDAGTALDVAVRMARQGHR